jgi:hypothetical protein
VSYTLRFDTGDEVDLATIGGWGQFTRWTDTIDPDEHGEVVHLAEYGWSQNLPELQEQLQAAAGGGEVPPAVHATALHLLRELKASGAEACVVSDGIEDEDGEEDANGEEGSKALCHCGGSCDTCAAEAKALDNEPMKTDAVHVGQQVRVTEEGPYFGRVGVVEYVKTTNGEIFVRFEDGLKRWFEPGDLTHADGEATDPMLSAKALPPASCTGRPPVSRECEEEGICTPLDRRMMNLRRHEDTLYAALENAEQTAVLTKSLYAPCFADVDTPADTAARDIRARIDACIHEQWRLAGIDCTADPENPACRL